MAKKTEFEDILASIDELAGRGKISRNNAFAAWFAINFFNVDEDEALESAAADGGNDQGVDIAFADENAQEIIVLQAYCPASADKVTPKNKWDAITASIPFIEDPDQLAKAGRPDMAEAIANLKKSYADFRIAYGLISLGKKSNEIDSSIEAHKASSKGKEVSFFFYHQDDIIERYDAQANAASGIAEDTLKFTGSHIEDEGEYGRSWIGSVSAAELQRLHKSHADNLFAGNIRLFLGSRKGGINEQIIKTAKEQPGAFWALNNGITIVADTAEVIKKKDASDDSQLKLRRFSIVNGCQTTSSLVEAKAKSTAKVLARVIAANAKIKIDIVQFNNSQNAVKIWTVRAADETQNNLRAKFAEIGIQYAPKLEGSRRARNSSIIELDRLTQFLASTSNEYLVQAIGNKGELFDQPYQKLFHRTITAPEVYLAWLVGNIADTERTKLLNGIQKDDENAGLLAVTSNYWIVYATYKLLAKLTKRTSPQITLEKMKAAEFQNALRKYVEKGAELFYDAAIDTYDRDDYGSFKSTLRATKFLTKMDSKLNARVAKPLPKPLPDLVSVCKSIKSAA